MAEKPGEVEMFVVAPQQVNNPNQNPDVVVVQQPPENQIANQNETSGNWCCWCICICICVVVGLAAIFGGLIALLLYLFPIQVCFDADSIVRVKKSHNNTLDIPLSDIKIGDYILTLNPETNELFWDEILMRVHYGWYDQKDSLTPMRTIHLENNISSITLSYDHFLFINDYQNNVLKVIPSKDIQIGDTLFHFDENKNKSSLIAVSRIDENVMKQYRIIFGLSQYILINNIVASPFVGPHPIYHDISYKMVTRRRFTFLRYISCPFISSFAVQNVGHLIFATYWIYSHPIEFCIVVITAYYSIYYGKYQFQRQKQNSK